MRNSFFIGFCCLRIGWFTGFSKKFVKITDFVCFFKMTPLSAFTQLKANVKSLTADFHRLSLKMVKLHTCRIRMERMKPQKVIQVVLAVELSIDRLNISA